jgi:hypothetical protein
MASNYINNNKHILRYNNPIFYHSRAYTTARMSITGTAQEHKENIK